MIKHKCCSLVFTGLLIFIAGCGEPSVEEMDETLANAGEAISKEAWQQAAEKIRTFEDYWHLRSSDYQKKDAKKIDKFIYNIEMSLAISDKKQSKRRWDQLFKRWEEIN